MPDTPELLRSNARECFRIARETHDSTIHLELLWLAQFYMNRASEIELGYRPGSDEQQAMLNKIG